MLEEKGTLEETEQLPNPQAHVEPDPAGSAAVEEMDADALVDTDVSVDTELSTDVGAPAEADVSTGAAESLGDEAAEDAPAPGDDDFDVDFDDPETDLGPSLAEELAAISLSEDDPEQEPEPEKVAEDDRHWYVIHCYSGYENKVRHNLEQRIETMSMQDQIFDVVVPTEEEIEVKEGKRRTVERRVFPGYILVQLHLSEESWYVVRNTPGVTGFVGMGNTPTPLHEQEVAQIMKRMEADAPTIKVSFKTGQKVRIIDGPFNDFIGSVGEIDAERGKVRVMVSFFGRETPVELDFLQVEKI